MIVGILFMMKKKGCDCMFKKLVMLLCFGILLSFSTVSAQANDELPPLVIETANIKYVGLVIDNSVPLQIAAERNTAVYKEPSLVSEKVGIIPKANIINEGAPVIDDKSMMNIIDFKVYIYPRMGKTVILSPIEYCSVRNINEKGTLNKGDTVYVIYKERNVFNKLIAWYKGKYIYIDSDKINIPFLSKENQQDIYTKYEGYVNEKDFSNDNSGIKDMVYTSRGKREVSFFASRRNADVWLEVELPDKTKGWVQITDAHLGASEQPDWWKYISGVLRV